MAKKISRKRRGIKMAMVVLANFLVLLFLLGIFLYDYGYIAESLLQAVAAVAAIIFLAVHGLQLEKDEDVASGLKNMMDGPKAVLIRAFRLLFRLNCLLYPFIALLAMVSLFAARLEVIEWVQTQVWLLIYCLALALLIGQSYASDPMKTKTGFLPAFYKLLFFVSVPAFAVSMLLAGKSFILIYEIVIAFMLITGSLWVLVRDRRFLWGKSLWLISVQYLTVFAVIIASYQSAVYLRDAEIALLFRPEVESGVFRDVPTDHWAYPAMYHLYENGLLQPDVDGFGHPELVLTEYEALEMIMDYYDILASDFAEHRDVQFQRVISEAEEYPLLKAAFHLNMVQKSLDPNAVASLNSALMMMGELMDWPSESGLKGYVEYAFKNKMITGLDARFFDDPLRRSVLAHILYKNHLNTK